MYQLELLDTAEMMCSADYKERFRAEYYQLKIRYTKLKAMTDTWDKGGTEALGFTPTCPRETYTAQLKAMRKYLEVLEYRAGLEGVGLRC